jgi:hypothetical protein
MRHFRKPRFPAAFQGKFGELTPVFKSMVFPGETQRKLAYKGRLATRPVKSPLAGGYLDIWFFYVPWRLVWPEWPDLVQEPDTTWPAPAVGVDTVKTLSGGSALPALSYQAIVNRYFRTDNDAVYDVSAGPLALARTPLDTVFLHGRDASENVSQTIDISDGLTTDEIRDAFAEDRHQQKLNDFSGKFADYLSQFGVRAREAGVSDPEPLGHVRKWVEPRKTVSQTTGFTVQSYQVDIDMRLDKPRFFAEHGYVIGIAAFRPSALSSAYGAWDVEQVFGKPGELPSPFSSPNRRDSAVVEGQSRSFYSDDFLRYGVERIQSVDIAADDNFVNVIATPTDAEYIFPTYSDVMSEAAPPWHWQLSSIASHHVATPLNLVDVA